jgi:hypothetical protein
VGGQGYHGLFAAQQEVSVALQSIGELDLAARLNRCMMARRERRNGDGWPRTCDLPPAFGAVDR